MCSYGCIDAVTTFYMTVAPIEEIGVYMETKNESPANPAAPAAGVSRKVLLFAVVIFIVVIVVVGVGIYALTRGGGGNGGNTNSGGGSSVVSGATSLQFSVTSTTTSGTPQGYSYTYYAKNIGASNFMLRIEYGDANLNYVYIVNGAEQKAWVEAAGIWTDLSSDFQTQLTTWNNAFKTYTTYLANYASGGTYTYNGGGEIVQYTNVVINPSLADSLFTH
jgi:hypothetical protein